MIRPEAESTILIRASGSLTPEILLPAALNTTDGGSGGVISGAVAPTGNEEFPFPSVNVANNFSPFSCGFVKLNE